ncbi:MAG: CRISPR-associated helicase Cas3' [Fimbriimonas sp.]
MIGKASHKRLDIEGLWAKSSPWHPLWKHLLDATAVCMALPNPLARWGWSREQGALIVGLHDVGKADAFFQHQVPEFSPKLTEAGFPVPCDARCRHERLSAKFIRDSREALGLSERDADTVGRAVIAHHGYWDEGERPVGPEYREAQSYLFEILISALRLSGAKVPPVSEYSAFGMRLAGNIVLCDWIASDTEFFTDSRLSGINEPIAYLEAARLVASKRIERLGFVRDTQPGLPAAVVPTPRPLQKALLENQIAPGLAIIEAPMGEGKTEAAWILAEKWRDYGYHGMYMALPTMATSDSLHGRYRDTYLKKLGRDEDTKLVHGMAWLRDDKESESPPEVGEKGDDRYGAAAWFRPTRRAMLAAHGVGTVDQAMLAGMHVKFGFLRLFGLADRVLVIDEVHAYDAYMSAIICRLLQWCACLRIPVVLLSATLSARQRAAMIEAYGAVGGDAGPAAPYPLITVAEAGKEARGIRAVASSSRELKLETHIGLLGDAAGTAKKALELVTKGGCCCVILNTVKQAQAVYQALGNDCPKLLFHARFTAADREVLTNRVLDLFGKDTAKRPEKFILVATQVVEQSLDVDFDHMVSEVAPMDLLLQRSGRLHRHRARVQDPVLHILTPAKGEVKFGGTGYVYADKPLLRTVALLSNRESARLPDDFRILIERTYGEDRWDVPDINWETIKRADEEWVHETALESAQGTHVVLSEPSRRVFRPVNNSPAGDDSDDGNGWRAKTRLGANDRTTVLVTVAEQATLSRGELSKKAIKDLYRRSLKIARYLPVFAPAEGYEAAVEAEGRLKGLLLLPVSDNGLWRGQDERMNTYEIRYDQELGLLARKAS